ncbi:MAG: hypothetical protein QW688_02060 [Thermoprotei archaeon]
MVSHFGKQFLAVVFTSLFTLTWFRFKPIYISDMGLGTTIGHTTLSYVEALAKANTLGLSPWVYPGVGSAPVALLYTFGVNLIHTFAPLWLAQFAYVYVLALIAQLGVCALLGRVSHTIGISPPWWVGVVAGVFYVYAPFYQFFIGDGAYIPLGFYASYPLMVHASLGLTELGASDLRGYTKSLLTLIAAFFVGSGGFTYYYYITGVGSIVLISLVYLILVRRGWAGRSLGLGGLLLGLAAAQLSLAPIIVGDLTRGPTLAQSNTTSPNLLTLFLTRTAHTTYINQLTHNFWPAPGPFLAVNPNVPSYLTSPLIGAAFMALLLLLLMGSGKRDAGMRLRAAAPFLAAYLVALALAAGPEAPFGGPLIYVYTRIWFVRAITESFTSLNFIYQLSLAVLIGIALTHFKPNHTAPRNNTTRRVATLLLVVVTLTLAAPYAAGAPLPKINLVASPYGVVNSYTVTPRVQIPHYFAQLTSYANSLPPHGAVLLLPIGGNFRTTSWYMAVDALSSALTKPVVGGGYVSTPQTGAFVDLVVLWEQGAHIDLTQLLERMGVGYIVVEGDAASAPPFTPEPQFNLTYIESQLNTTPNITPIARFGPDVIYRVDWANTTIGWGDTSTLAYGFSVYTQAQLAQPQPQNPYKPLFNMSASQPAPGKYVCTLVGGTLYITLSGGYGECGFNTTITSTNPIYVSYAYQSTLSGAGVTLRPVGGGPANIGLIVAQGVVGDMNYAVTLFPPGSYTDLEVYVSGGPITYGAKAEVGWVYASSAAFPTQLIGYNTSTPTLFVTQPAQGYTPPHQLLDSTSQPRVESQSCSVYACTVSVEATQPFIFVYYTAYSDSYTLKVNGQPDADHYAAYGSFNAWLVNTSGTLTLSVEYTNPLLVYEALSLGVWIVVIAAYLYSTPWRRPRVQKEANTPPQKYPSSR